MTESKKITVRKKMSMREYVNLISFLETGDRDLDLSEYDESVLAVVEVKVLRLTQKDKERMDEFFNAFALGVSLKSVLDSLPKKNSEAPAPAAQPAAKAKVPIKKDLDVVETPEGKKLNIDYNADIADFDYVTLVESVQSGTLTAQEAIDNLGDNKNAQRLLLIPVPQEVKDMHASLYKGSTDMFFALQDAEGLHKRILAILNEPEPTQEEIFGRYKGKYLSKFYQAKNEETNNYRIISEEKVESISGNTIVFDELSVVEYDNADDLEYDVMHLVKHGKLDYDATVDVFGKKISAKKIVTAAFKKNPKEIHGERFFATRKEAFEAGELQA